MDGTLRVVQSSGKKIDWEKFKDMYSLENFLRDKAKKYCTKPTRI